MKERKKVFEKWLAFKTFETFWLSASLSTFFYSKKQNNKKKKHRNSSKRKFTKIIKIKKKLRSKDVVKIVKYAIYLTGKNWNFEKLNFHMRKLENLIICAFFFNLDKNIYDKTIKLDTVIFFLAFICWFLT